MKASTRNTVSITIIGILLCIVMLDLLLNDYTSEAQLSFKMPTPFHRHVRQKTIQHADFSPKTITQNRNPHFDVNKRLELLVGTAIDADDKSVIGVIRNYVINQPSTGDSQLNNSDLYDYSGGQSAIIDSSLRFKENGFYIECCISDGEKDSTSLFFERVRKWNGLVMTADPRVFSQLSQKNRKAITANACLSRSLTIEKTTETIRGTTKEIFCFPLHLIMLAIGRSDIDLLAFDVGGKQELSVLKAIPLDRLNIEMMSVRFRGEIRHFKSDVQRYLESVGYETILKLIKEADDSVHHLILKRNGQNYVVTSLKLIGVVFIIFIFGALTWLTLRKCRRNKEIHL